MMETSGRPQNEDGPMYYYLWGLAQIRSDDRVCFRETMRMINTRYRFMPAGKEKHDWIEVYLNLLYENPGVLYSGLGRYGGKICQYCGKNQALFYGWQSSGYLFWYKGDVCLIFEG